MGPLAESVRFLREAPFFKLFLGLMGFSTGLNLVTWIQTGHLFNLVIAGVNLAFMTLYLWIFYRMYRNTLQLQPLHDSLRSSMSAEDRAMTLFLDSLSAVQRREWDKTRSITVIGSDNGRYTLTDRSKGGPYNVVFGDRRYCAYPRPYERDHNGYYHGYPGHRLPEGDTLLVQKLLLETDAEGYRKMACSQ